MFLLADSLEVLFGGAGGPGKSSALLMAAAQYVNEPNYSALLTRRSLTDNKPAGSLIQKSKEWWHHKGPKYNTNDFIWTFPSGATIQLAYLDSMDDARRYNSSEFQFIGIDELTEMADENVYRFMFSRLRRRAGVEIPLRFRSCTNPGGPGHLWVKKRFGLEGKPTKPIQHDGRIFIPANIHDNPSLDAETYIQSLGELDPITRGQIMSGDWEAFRGGRFKPSWLSYYRKQGNLFWFGDKNYTNEQIGNRFLTVDPASTVQKSESHDPDWTAISAWGTTPCGKLVWLDTLRGRWEIPDIATPVGQMYLRNNAGMVHCEGFGIGLGPPQLLKRYRLPGAGFMNLVTYSAQGKKILNRASAALNLAEAGRLWLPENDPKFEDAEAEVLRFTGDESADGHDDIVETLCKAAMVVAERDVQQYSGTPMILRSINV